MERDALIDDVAKQQKYAQEQLLLLFQQWADNKRILKQDRFSLIIQRWAGGFLLLIMISSYVASYLYFLYLHDPVLASILGGLAVTLSVLLLVMNKYIQQKTIQRDIRKQELEASQMAIQKSLDLHQNKIRALKSKSIQLRYQTRTIR